MSDFWIGFWVAIYIAGVFINFFSMALGREPKYNFLITILLWPIDMFLIKKKND